MGGAVVVFLSFQLHCIYTYMKQFSRQCAGASHHLHDASARNVNTPARPHQPFVPACYHHRDVHTHTHTRSIIFINARKKTPKPTGCSGRWANYWSCSFIFSPCSIFRPWGSPHSDSDLPVGRDVC